MIRLTPPLGTLPVAVAVAELCLAAGARYEDAATIDGIVVQRRVEVRRVRWVEVCTVYPERITIEEIGEEVA